MKLKLLSLLLFLAIFKVNEAADVDCTFAPAAPETPFPSCQSFTITPVTSPNEKITILNQPSDYIDQTTSSFSFDQNSVINYIPTELFKHFPRFMSFYAYNASITTLVTDAFNYCGNLTSIYLYQNSIAHVPARIASSCYSVTDLNFNENQIETIDEKAFEGMESLRSVFFYSNKISCIPPKLFQSNLGLSYIDFNTNRITALHPTLFKDLTQVQMINFQQNNLSYIPNFNFFRTGTVSGYLSISMYGNPIVAIDPEFLMTYFYSRDSFGMGQLSFYFQPNGIDQPSCIDSTRPELQMLHSIGSYNWYQNHVLYKRRTSCYSNWNLDMATNSLITCGSGA